MVRKNLEGSISKSFSLHYKTLFPNVQQIKHKNKFFLSSLAQKLIHSFQLISLGKSDLLHSRFDGYQKSDPLESRNYVHILELSCNENHKFIFYGREWPLRVVQVVKDHNIES